MRRNSPLSWSGAEDTGFVLAPEPSVDAFLTTDVAFRAGLVPLDS